MSLDRRIYLTTALAALLIGSAVVIAAPGDPFEGIMTIHGGTDASSRLGGGNGLIRREDAAAPTGVVLPKQSENGVRAPSQWPVLEVAGAPSPSVTIASR